jgi:hypothetical protein
MRKARNKADTHISGYRFRSLVEVRAMRQPRYARAEPEDTPYYRGATRQPRRSDLRSTLGGASAGSLRWAEDRLLMAASG